MPMRRLLVATVSAVGLAVVPTAAHAQEPLELPDASCNQATQQARTTAPEPADSAIPHERRTGECHHAVPSGG